jgi:hypothetical protein
VSAARGRLLANDRRLAVREAEGDREVSRSRINVGWICVLGRLAISVFLALAVARLRIAAATAHPYEASR